MFPHKNKIWFAGLETFAKLGLGQIGETLIGGVLGLIAGLIGSFVGAGSINDQSDDDIRTLRKKNESGLWLLLLETPLENELPWNAIREISPIEIVNLRD